MAIRRTPPSIPRRRSRPVLLPHSSPAGGDASPTVSQCSTPPHRSVRRFDGPLIRMYCYSMTYYDAVCIFCDVFMTL